MSVHARIHTSRRNCCRIALALLAGIGLAILIGPNLCASPAEVGKKGITRFRLGTIPTTFGNSSRNDTKAAITAWAQNILLQQDSISLDSDIVTVFEKSEELLNAYERREIDGITLAAEDFSRVKSRPDSLFLMYKNGSPGTRYVILVHRSSAIEDVRDLKGRRVVLHSSPSMGLATPWLDVLLASRSLGLSQQVFGSASRIDAASRAILQVFFRQAEACVVGLDTFKTACELNPQVEKDLRALVISPELIPTMFFFHPGYDLREREVVEDAIRELDKSPAGQQVLTVFQSERLVKVPVSNLVQTLALCAEYERVKRGEAVSAKWHSISQPSMPSRN